MSGALTRQVLRVTLSARGFAFLALAGPVLWYREQSVLLGLGVIGLVWALAWLTERRAPHLFAVPVVEAGLTGVVAGQALGSSSALLLALAVPPFVAAVVHGLRGCVLALCAELSLVLTSALIVIGRPTADQSLTIFTWSIAGLGLGMIGNFLHATMTQPPTDELTPYLDAQRLIRRLLDLSDNLSSGLDTTTLAGSVLGDVGDLLPATAAGVYVPRGEVLVPLVTTVTGAGVELGEAEELAVESWARSEPLVHEHAFAFPLGDSAVVAGRLAYEAELQREVVERSILQLMDSLRPKAVQLDTALLFATFRDNATADVRKRLAREMHDGVAQDIASLGYLVDALAARPTDDKQAKALGMLRERITRVVAEVRQSVLTLRTSIGESESLGAAISTVARHLSESSRIPIQVVLDEHSTRLRPEVEAELFRIAQEAMNNAIKHAQCDTIEVHCQVHAPNACITVSDDGRGMQAARSDSHGLKIMRERARLIGGDLDISDNPTGGLTVSVSVGAPARPFPRPADAGRV